MAHKAHKHARFLRLVLLPALVINLLAYALIATIFQPLAAHAQAYVIGSDPVDGSTVNAVPKEIRIFFDDTISPLSVATIQYVQNGGFVPVQGQSFISSSNPHELDIPLPSNSMQGSYLVSWTAISNNDGRTTYGKIGFNIGSSYLGLSGQVTLGPSSSNDFSVRSLDLLGILSIAWEWLVEAALVFWIGILIVERFVLPRMERATSLLEHTRRQTLPLQTLCLSALLIGEVITLLLREVHVTRALYDGTLDFSALLPFLTQTVYGWVWLARFCLLLLALVLLWWFSRPYQKNQENTTQTPLRPGSSRLQGERGATSTPKATLEGMDHPSRPPASRSVLARSQDVLYARPVTIAGVAFTLLLLCTYALTDTQDVRFPGAANIVGELLRLAPGIWFGSLAYLGFVILPLLPTTEGDSRSELLATFLRRLTPYLATGILLELASMLFLSEMTIPTPAQWLSDPYGRALLGARALIVVMLLLTLYTLLVVRPRIARQAALLPVVNAELPARRTRQTALERQQRSLKQLVSVQTILGAGVLLCMTLLSVVFPNVTYTNTPTNSGSPPQTQSIGGLTVTLQVSPARVNTTNTITLHIKDAQGAPVTNAQVKVITNMETMNMGVAQQTASGNGATYTAHFTASDSFSMTGVWDVRVIIQRSGHTNVTMTFAVPVG